MRRALAHVMIAAVFALDLLGRSRRGRSAGTENPGGRGHRPGLPPAGGRRQDVQPRGLRRREGPGRALHLQPLPDRPGVRGSGRPPPRRLSRQGGRPRRHLAERPGGGPARRARLQRPRRLVRGDEDPREGQGIHLSLPLRRRDPGDGQGVWRAGHAPRLRLRRRPEAPLRRQVRRRGGQAGEVARHDQRRRGAAGRQAGPRREDPGLRLLDEVGRQAGRRQEGDASARTPSR